MSHGTGRPSAVRGYFILLLSFATITAPYADTHCVDRIINGDTFVLDSGDKVRLIGVDCPEALDPNKKAGHYHCWIRAV